MRAALLIAFFTLTAGCKSIATGAVADALSGSGGVYGSDDDPELVGAAIPFALKTMESVLVEEPNHVGLLTALASGFTQYGYAFVQQEADAVGETDIDRSLLLMKRARKLYLRARAYGMRGLEARHEQFTELYKLDRAAALSKTTAEDIPLLYWTAASWGLVIGTSKDDPETLAQFPELEPLARRALELDEAWNKGTLHEFFLSLEASAPTGDAKKARQHFARAVELSEGKRAGPYVTLAERVSVKEQNAKEFHQLLDRALAIDLDASPDDRLANVLMQRRAARLKKMSGDLFLEDTGS
jgi:predicted anti-sigma-YlaC factor YlaD